MPKTIRVKVEGRVQGVSFRAWTQERAERLGLLGWVRNEPDGGVAVLLSGDQAAVDAMLEQLHQGPLAARVDAVRAEEVDEHPAPGFGIRT